MPISTVLYGVGYRFSEGDNTLANKKKMQEKKRIFSDKSQFFSESAIVYVSCMNDTLLKHQKYINYEKLPHSG